MAKKMDSTVISPLSYRVLKFRGWGFPGPVALEFHNNPLVIMCGLVIRESDYCNCALKKHWNCFAVLSKSKKITGRLGRY